MTMTSPFLTERPSDEHIEVNDIQLSELSDQMKTMKFQEETTYKCDDYVSKNDRVLKTVSAPIDEECRLIMCKWCYRVVDFCHFQRESVSIAFSILDRYLGTAEGLSAVCDRQLYQLATMTSLYIAIKMNETVALGLDTLVRQSRSIATKEEFEKMELKILSALQWKANGPTPLAFVRCFMAYMPANVDKQVRKAILNFAKYQVELVVSDYNIVNHLPSEIAAAAIVNGIMEMNGKLTSLETLKTMADFSRSVEMISGVYIDANSSLEPQPCALQVLKGANESEEKEDKANVCHDGVFCTQRNFSKALNMPAIYH